MTTRSSSITWYARFVIANRKLLGPAYMLLTALALAQLPSIEIHTSLRDYRTADANGLQVYDAFLEAFGGNPTIMVALESERPLDPAALAALSTLQNELSAKLDIHELVSPATTHVRTGTHLRALTDFFDDPVRLAEIVAEHPHLWGRR